MLQGFKQLVEGADAKEIVTAYKASEGFRRYRTRRPDIIVLDLQMQAGAFSGLSFLRRLRLVDVETPVLVLSLHRDPAVVGCALRFGASGYVPKDAAPEEVLRAFQLVRDGQSYISPELASDVVFHWLDKRTKRLKHVTSREFEVLTRLAKGMAYGEIAEDLELSYRTIGNTCARLKRKLGAQSRVELMRAAMEYVTNTS
ncbi:MAG: DNA-binding response regulator [Methyloceanibacter sp.]|nr:MAG: DNA-binding response regulator [Methyloceanibacter sp.]